jgi:hypothetical protein
VTAFVVEHRKAGRTHRHVIWLRIEILGKDLNEVVQVMPDWKFVSSGLIFRAMNVFAAFSSDCHCST